MTLWLYLHFPMLQLDSLLNMNPSEPVAIIDKRVHQVTQLNDAARQDGINVGMGLGTAAALSHGLQIHSYDEQVELEQLKQIAQWLYLISADISLFSTNGLLLKCSNMLSLYRDLSHYWHAIEEHLACLSIHYQFATAYSPYAAKLLAIDKANVITDNAEHISQLLGQRPLALTELTSKVIHQLNRVGVHRLKQLLDISLSDIAKRFNIEVVTYVGRLTGQLQHVVDFYHPPEKFQHYLELLFDVTELQRIEKPLYKVYSLLEHFLVHRNKLAQDLLLEFHLRDVDNLLVSVSAAQGEYRAKEWLSLSQLTLESISLNGAITGITVSATHLTSIDVERSDLFKGRQGDISKNKLVSMLQAKLGKDQVYGVRLVDDHRPEVASQRGQLFSSKQSVSHILALRPSFLLPDPQPLIESVDITQGPERIVTAWWEGEQVIRDYFVARSKQGRWLWIYRTPEKKWFIHGFFS